MRFGVVQHDIVWEDRAANFARLAPLVARAAGAGAEFVLLSETFSTGFSMTPGIGEPECGPSSQFLAAQAAACLMWIVHYGLLGAMTAATINILSFARSVVFYFNDRKWAKSRAWLWAFLALYVVNTVLTWDGPRSLLPGIAMSMTTIALWTRDMRRTRLLYLTNSPFWFTYDILARSYSCMVIEAIAFVSYVVAVWRFDIKKQPQT